MHAWEDRLGLAREQEFILYYWQNCKNLQGVLGPGLNYTGILRGSRNLVVVQVFCRNASPDIARNNTTVLDVQRPDGQGGYQDQNRASSGT